MANLTKRNLVIKISEETELTQGEVLSVIQKTLDSIIDTLANGEDVELRNFGVFEVRLTKLRVGRNPNVPDVDVPIPPRAIVKFKSGKVMRQQVLLRTEELANAGGPAKKRKTYAKKEVAVEKEVPVKKGAGAKKTPAKSKIEKPAKATKSAKPAKAVKKA